MPTTYTPLLKVAKPGAGELDGSWGDVVNNNITTMLEEAIAGRSVIDSWSGNSHTLTEANGTTSEARSAMLELAGTPTAAVTVICPNSSKIYVVSNGCGFDATIKTAVGTGVTVANGATKIVFCDGTNVKAAVSGVEDHTHIISDVTGLQSALDLKLEAGDVTAPNNPTITLTAGTGLTGGGSFTLNQAGNATVTFNGVSLSGTNTWTGPQTFTEIKETVYALSGTDINPSSGSVQTKTFSADTTFTANSFESGQSVVLMVSSGANYQITWPSITWAGPTGNTAPTLTASDVVVFWKIGSTLYGAYVGSYA